jgi:FG-GAP repeat
MPLTPDVIKRIAAPRSRVVVAVVGALLAGSAGIAVAQQADERGSEADRANAERLERARAQGVERERVRRTDPSLRAERSRSRSEFRALGADEAIAVARKKDRGALAPRDERVLSLGEGARVRSYVNRNAAVIDRPGSRDAVVSSAVPLLAVDGNGRLAPVDVSLLRRADGDFAPSNSLADVRIGPEAREGVRFVNSDFTLASSASSAEGRAVDGRVFYANVATDTDLVVSPIPQGAETFHLLRSPASPERLTLAIRPPDGGRLRWSAEAGNPFEEHAVAPRVVEIVDRRGHVRARILPVSGIDAQGAAVPVKMRIVGRALVLDVDHRDRDLAYPITVDPFVIEDWRYWYNGTATDFVGWTFRDSPAGYVPGAAAPDGLRLATYAPATYPSNSFGEWRWTAPASRNAAYPAEGSYIFKVDFGNYSHSPSTPATSCIVQGIYSNQLANWEQGAVYRGPQPTDPTAASPYFACALGELNAYKVHCTESACTQAGGTGTVGTVANSAITQLGPAAGTSTKAASYYIGSALIFLRDHGDPHLTVSAPTAWVDNAGGSVSADDYGLGMASVVISAGTWSARQDVCGTASGQPGDYDGNRHARCPTNATTSFTTAATPEGATTATATATDVISRQTSQPVTLKVDRTAPTITPSGTLWDAREQFVGADTDFTLHVVATDGAVSPASAQRSGVTSLTVTLDGQPVTGGAKTQTCTAPEGSCSLTADITLTAAQLQSMEVGGHTFSMTATDALGHTAPASTFTFKLDPVAPTSFLDGNLEQLSGRTLTESSYQLRAESRDNQPFQPEIDDTADDPEPFFDKPGAGLLDLVIRLDGQTVPTTGTACFDDSQCEDARIWDWDTTTVANGEHTITVTATDRVGNQDVREFLVTLQRAPDQPARTDADVRRTILGASGDRAGSAVSAAGDVNGDGYADYLVGAPGATASGRVSSGAAYLVLGSQSASTVDLATPGAAVRFLGSGANQFCGASVAVAGDVNGDGYDDYLIGCPGLDPNVGSLSSTGTVYVVFGRPDPQDIDLATIGAAGFVITGPADAAGIGSSISSRPAVFGERLQSASASEAIKDLNDDDLDDIVIGDSAVNRGSQTAAGVVYVVYGKAGNATVNANGIGSAGYVVRGTGTSQLTGYAVAIADVDGDTTGDLVIGAPGATPTTTGRAYVIRTDPEASGDIDLAAADGRIAALTTGVVGDRFGVNVTGLGDTDLDTHNDLAISTSSGAYVLRTIPSASRQVSQADGYRVVGPTNDPGVLLTRVPEAPVSSAGDLDGDERTDLIVGYPDTDAARAYTIRSPETSRTINVTALPGQRGAAIATGTRAQRAGSAVGANSYQGATPVSERAQAIIGAPAAIRDLVGVSAGAAYVVAEPTPTGPGADQEPEPPAAAVGGLSAQARTTSTRAALESFPMERGYYIPGKSEIAVDPAATRWVTVRNDTQAFVIGSAHDADPFWLDDALRNRGDTGGQPGVYVHGRLFGGTRSDGEPDGIQRCGWVLAEKVPAPGTARTAGEGWPRRCGADRRLSPSQFASLINCDACDDGSFVHLRRRGGQAMPAMMPVYRNVRPGTREGHFSSDDPVPTSTINGARMSVNWRYITKSGKFVLVRASRFNPTLFGNNKWAFIPRTYLPHTYRQGGLCDNTGDAGAPAGDRNYRSEPVDKDIRPGRKDWGRVCAHRKYNVPDTDG